MVDESALRRGRQTANALFGNAASVLVGDFVYSRAFQMMVSVNRMRVLDVLADATNVIAEGEVLQLMNMHDPDLAVDDYLRVIRFKTAKLFEASARLGAVLADADSPVEEACAAYGRSLGTAFQLVDDLLDYEGATVQLGKNVGDDLREGKPTLAAPDRDGARLGGRARSWFATRSSTAKSAAWARSSRSCAAPALSRRRAKRRAPRPTRRGRPWRRCPDRPIARLC